MIWGQGDDWGSAFAGDTTIFGGAGNGILAVRQGHRAVLGGGDGNDYFEVVGDATVLGGAGADTVLLQGPSGGWQGLQASVSTGDDNDLVTATDMTGSVDLGAGDDHIVTGGSSGSAPVQITIATGADRDTITTYGQLSGQLTITDFDPTQDVINIAGVDRLRDFDAFRNGPAGVTLVEGNMTLVLLVLTLAELPELVFVP